MAKFKRIYIEISNLCNLGCSFCPEVLRPNKILKSSDFKIIVERVKTYADEICLHLMGEPLVHPEFPAILNIANEEGIFINLTTNGTLLKKHEELLLNSSSLRQINFSVQSFRDNFPKKDLEPYLDTLRDFIFKLHESKPETYVNLRLWNLGARTFENNDVISYCEKTFETTIKRDVDVGHIKSKNIWNRVYLHFDSRFDWPSFYLPNQGTKGTCHALKSHLGIHADGTVVPCCLDKEAKIPLGNIFEQTLKEILESERATKMREGFDRGERIEKLCQHCTYINRFSKGRG